jgi:hypothetical protein
MSANKHLPHLLVIPEDDANQDIMTGFRNHLSVNSRQIQVTNVANGWKKAINTFLDEHAGLMRKFETRYVLIMIDFDDRENRFEYALNQIPEDLRNRVFIMGCQDEPERVRAATGLTKEKLGEALAEACSSMAEGLWGNEILAHNQRELERMQTTICRHLME